VTAQYLWLIPVLPLLAAGISALVRQSRRRTAATLAIGSMAIALGLALLAFARVVAHSGQGAPFREVAGFRWLQFGEVWIQLGWVLDPLTAVMLVMVTLVGLLIFIYSVGYMAHDENFTRFFCFLSLFAAAMLGVLIANHLLLLFVCWELVGLTSYLLIGFWYHKPSAAAAAKKAFITTRIGDLAFLLGMVWLYSQTGTLQFYDGGHGCLEESALIRLVTQGTTLGLAASAGIGLLLFGGAIGKSGQLPLHVWLPDAMEGPTPVSALIHAATMVAAGVFLVARVYPLMSIHLTGAGPTSLALQAVAWVGALTAVFAATIAVAQTDIKRILAYSTVSQLGFMMLGLGLGGVAVGMFHLITHAFFKALLFMGAGSVIHGCHEEQDIRRLGGLRQFMPVTFATYAIGMLALSGFPLLFSGFWSKDGILHAAHHWEVSHWPFYLGVAGALLTAFYMTRQMVYVFFGPYRGAAENSVHAAHAVPHESPKTMLVPLLVLAGGAILLGFVGTPAWPWFQAFLDGHAVTWNGGELMEKGVLTVMALSTGICLLGMGLGYWLYGRQAATLGAGPETIERWWPDIVTLWRRKYFVDEAYEWGVVGFTAWWSRACDWLDRCLFSGVVALLSYSVLGFSWINRLLDEYVVNSGFDEGCRRLAGGGRLFSRLQAGRVQFYLRAIGVGLVGLVLFLVWGFRAG